jgi:hypothetical protein
MSFAEKKMASHLLIKWGAQEQNEMTHNLISFINIILNSKILKYKKSKNLKN